MSIEQWYQLEQLCREALDNLAELGVAEEHDVTQAIKLTGAFSASVQHNMKLA